MKINLVATLAALMAAGVLMSVTGAMAVEAAAKSAVNVRTGPSKDFGVVDQLTAGEVVEVKECAPSNFCFVEHSGPDGWVSANYLTSVEDEEEDEVAEGSGDNPDCSFGFSVGAGGAPSLSINCGDAPVPPPPVPAGDDDEDVAEACFFTGADFVGEQFCMEEGTRNNLNGTFNNKITSVELSGGLKAKLCEDPTLGGYCRDVNTTTEQLVSAINNKASSLVVYSGPPPLPTPPTPPAIPVTFSTGGIDLAQTWSANFDNGTSGSGGEDVWYEAVTSSEKYLKPVNGGKMAIGDGTNRGFAGCSAESFSGVKVALDDAPVGTYICVKTNEGRISQFRVNGFTGTTMKVGYTTWAN